MNWLDLLIVYLACGTPFAIYRIALSERAAAETAIRSARAGFLWPLVGTTAVIERLRRKFVPSSRSDIRSEMESLLATGSPEFCTFIFREVFDRYVSLAVASSAKAIPASAQLFEVSGMQATAASAECRRRVNAGKIRHHLATARSELLEYILAADSQPILDLAAALAGDVMDRELAAELSPIKTRAADRLPVRLSRLPRSAS